jgi:hypothetical protein
MLLTMVLYYYFLNFGLSPNKNKETMEKVQNLKNSNSGAFANI